MTCNYSKYHERRTVLSLSIEENDILDLHKMIIQAGEIFGYSPHML